MRDGLGFQNHSFTKIFQKMHRLDIIFLLLLITANTCAQEISEQEAAVLRKMLNEKSTADTTQVQTLLKLASYNILKPEELKEDLDSAERYMNLAAGRSAIVHMPEARAYLKLLGGNLHKERGNNQKELFAVAVEELRPTKDKFHLAMAEIELSKFYNANVSSEMAQKMTLINDAAILIEQSGSLLQKIYALQELKYAFYEGGFVNAKWRLSFLNRIINIVTQVQQKEFSYLRAKDIAEYHILQEKTGIAINELLQLSEEYKANRYPQICNVYDLLDRAYILQGNYDKALYYAFETIKSMKVPEDSVGLVGFYIRFNNIYTILREFDKAREWMQKILDYYISNRNLSGLYKATGSIVDGLLRDHKPNEALKFILDKKLRFPPGSTAQLKDFTLSLAKCYAALKNNSFAEKYYLEAIRLDEVVAGNGTNAPDYKTNQQIGLFYLSTGQFDKAQRYLDKAFREWPEDLASSRIQFRDNYMFKLDSVNGRYVSAIRYLQHAQQFKDSTFTETKSKQIEELQISYETEQKKSDIKILQDKEKIQRISLKQATTTRNWIIFGAAMLLVMLGISYNRYRLKQRSNIQLQAQREEIGNINKDLNNLVIEKENILTQKEHLLKEKEWLLKEVHHRVKNNLQIIISLLNTQSNYLDSEAAIKAIRESQERMNAISLIHQKLYKSEDAAFINIKEYVHELVEHIRNGFSSSSGVVFDLNVSDSQMDVAQAVPLGLILNEAISNAVKYAFPDGSSGLINISINHSTADDNYLLTVADNGVGLPPDYDLSKKASFGIRLMQGLSKQLGGHFRIESENGVHIEMAFKSANIIKFMHS